ncbi:MAG: heme-binding protein [Candidatus Thiodiazotropha sp.]
MLTVLAMFFDSAYADSQQGSAVYQFRSISLEMASKAAWGAINDCRNRGYSVAAAVVDRGGNIQVQLRDRFAGPHTSETAYRKAWTANSFRQSTAELAGMLEERRIPDQVANNPGALLVGGGLTIEAGGEILGGICPGGRCGADSSRLYPLFP